MPSRDEIYEEAVTVVDEAANDVIDTLRDVAESNDYQFEWVVEKFRDKFNTKVRRLLN